MNKPDKEKQEVLAQLANVSGKSYEHAAYCDCVHCKKVVQILKKLSDINVKKRRERGVSKDGTFDDYMRSEALKLKGKGKTKKDICKELMLSVETVERYIG